MESTPRDNARRLAACVAGALVPVVAVIMTLPAIGRWLFIAWALLAILATVGLISAHRQ